MTAIAEHAPAASVECRIAPPFPFSVTPFGHKFGCAPGGAARLLNRARQLGLRPGGRELSRRIAATRPVRVGNGDTLCRGQL